MVSKFGIIPDCNKVVSITFPSRKRLNPSSSITLCERLSKPLLVSGKFTLSVSLSFVFLPNPQHPLCMTPQGLTESTPSDFL